MKNIKLKNKFKYWHLFLLFLVVVLFGLSLPTFGVWSVYPQKTSQTQMQQIASGIRHPPIPKITTKNLPQIGSAAYIIVDNDTNMVLAGKSVDSRVYPASTTKLATALTALNIYPLDEIVSVGSTYSEGKVMELQTGEKITVKSLATALLVYSANDSAFNLASHYSGSVTGFVKEMNQLVAKYNLKSTHFTNYDGIHSPDHYSTVSDLAQLARLAIKNQFIRDTVKTKSVTVSDITNTIRHHLTATNELLGVVPEIEGLKTGWTPEAGGCFIGLVNINGHYLITVVAQSEDRFADTTKLVDWAKQSITWKSY